MSELETNNGSMFIGGEPPFLLFEIQFHSLFHVVDCHKSEVGDGPLQYENNPAAAVGLIGLVAHFEAFCKHHFAALINLNRLLLSRFAEQRPQTTILLGDLTMLMDNRIDNIGAVVAEQYDFGSATLINGLFRDLIGVTPFSKDEACKFDKILWERNCLVHHGGIFTLQMLKKGSDRAQCRGAEVFRSMLSICTTEFGERCNFIFEMAMKIARITVRAAREISTVATSVEVPMTEYEPLLQGLYDVLE